MNAIDLHVIKQNALNLKQQRLREDPTSHTDTNLERDCIVEAVCDWWYANTGTYPTLDNLERMKPLIQELENLKPRYHGFKMSSRKFVG